jgi:superfamily I DNA/RNA helicase
MASHYRTHSMEVFIGDGLPRNVVNELSAQTKKYMSDPVREIIYQSRSVRAYRSIESCLCDSKTVPEEKSLKAWLHCGGTKEEWASIIKPLVGEKLDEVSEMLQVQCKSPEIKRVGVAVTTAHAAKGLEWPHVFVVGANQQQMPGAKKGWRRNEELRLLYVEITRAIESLHIVIDETSQWSEFLCDEHGRTIV